MIRLEHVSKTFDTVSGDVHAVKEVNLEIQDGEIFGIIGFSGAGKSTLVRCINPVSYTHLKSHTKRLYV